MSLLRRTIKKEQEENPNKHVVIIIERSLLTDKNIFAKMLYDDKKIEHVNYTIYLKWFHEFAEEVPLSGLVYVYNQPEICHKRMMSRGRNAEAGVPLAYLQNCHKYHEDWLNYETEAKNVPLLKIDATIDMQVFNLLISLFISFLPEFQDIVKGFSNLQ